MTDPSTWRMDAYYYAFAATREVAVDRILSAVACAGKAFHSTSQWNDEMEYIKWDHIEGESPVDWIQNAALMAAKEMRALRKRVAELEADRERLEMVFVAAAGMRSRETLDKARVLWLASRPVPEPTAELHGSSDDEPSEGAD